MPFPALLGLGALGTLLSTIVTRIFIALTAKWVAKVAILGVIFIALNLALDALLLLLTTVVAPLIQSLPPSVTGLIGAFLPSNTVACISAIITVELGCAVYSATIKSLEFQAKLVSG